MRSPKAFNILLILIVLLVAGAYLFFYGRKSDTFYGDALGYYMYLPSTFIYHNHKQLEVLPGDKDIPQSVTWQVNNIQNTTSPGPRGYIVNQYTYGVAFMELPFFLAAHAFEKARGNVANGYSKVYDYAIKFSSLLYAFLGLVLIYRILRNYYGDRLSLITAAVIFTGTNLFWFSVHQAGMAHVPLFFLYALLIWLTIRLYRYRQLFIFIALGLTAGMITIIRPTDIICLAIPLLYGVHNTETLVSRWHFIRQHWEKVLCSIIAFAVAVIPQLIYWKLLTGSFLYYSYGQQSFNWSNPKIIEGLFYFSNGWFAYTPIMLFAVMGMFLRRHIKEWHWCLWLILPIYVYIIYSWYCYNYINGFGSRPMIHLYPLLAIPLAAFIHFVWQRQIWLKGAFAMVCLFFVALNVCNSMQKAKGNLDSDYSNAAFHWQTLFRMHLRYRDIVAKDIGQVQPDASKLTKLRTLACEDYEDSLDEHYVWDHRKAGKYVYNMQDDEYHPKGLTITYDERTFKGAQWIRASGKFLLPQPPADYEKHTLVLEIKRGNEFLLWKGCRIYNKLGAADGDCGHTDFTLDHYEVGEFWNVYFFVRIPGKLLPGDQIMLGVWNMPRRPILIDDICLELYKR